MNFIRENVFAFKISFRKNAVFELTNLCILSNGENVIGHIKIFCQVLYYVCNLQDVLHRVRYEIWNKQKKIQKDERKIQHTCGWKETVRNCLYIIYYYKMTKKALEKFF